MSRSSRSRLTRGLCGFAALALFLGACSESGQDAADFARGYTQVTKAFQTRTETIKAAASERADGAGSILSVYEDVLQSTRLATEEYSDLTAPADFEAAFSAVVSSLKGQVEALEQLIESAEKKDSAGVDVSTRDLAGLIADWQEAVGEMNRLLAECDECGEAT